MLCEENDPKLVELHLIMLLAFEYVEYGRAASGYACVHTVCVQLCTRHVCVYAWCAHAHVLCARCCWHINKVFAIQLQHLSWDKDSLRVQLFASKSDATGLNQHFVHL